MRPSSPPPEAPRPPVAPPTAPPAGPSGGQPIARTPRWMMLAIIVAVLFIAGAIALSLAIGRPHQPTGTVAAQPTRSVAGALNGRQSGDFSVVSGVTALTVNTADLGDDMYRVTTPGNANLAPQVQDNGDKIQLTFVNVKGDPTNSAQVLLNSKVRWQLHLVGGSSNTSVDLRTADLAGLDVATGVTRIEMWLPAPKGTLAVQMSGGSSEFLVHAAAKAPARVRVGSGAGSLTVDGTTKSGVSGGTVQASTGWDTSTDRYDVNIASGVGNFVLDRY